MVDHHPRRTYLVLPLLVQAFKIISEDPLLECPEWYEEAWQTGNYPIPDALKRAGYGEATCSRGIVSADDTSNDVDNGNNGVDNENTGVVNSSDVSNGGGCHHENAASQNGNEL